MLDLYQRATARLSGAPDELLTITLLVAAVVFVVAALKAPPLVKAFLVAILFI